MDSLSRLGGLLRIVRASSWLLIATALPGCGDGSKASGDHVTPGSGGIATDGTGGSERGDAGTEEDGVGNDKPGTGGSDGTESGGAATGGSSAGGSATGGSGSSSVCSGTPTASCDDTLCDTLPGCTADEPSECTGNAEVCSAYDGEVSACAAQWGCGLGTNGVCDDYDTECFDISEEDCDQFEGCWTGGLYCNGDIVKNCAGKTSRASCESSPVCFWTASDEQYCLGVPAPCDSMTPDTCTLQAGCSLTPAKCSGTPASCDGLSQSECLSQPGCKLSSGGAPVVKNPGISETGPDLVFESVRVSRYHGGTADDVSLYLDMEEINRGSGNAAAHTNSLFLSDNDIYGDADDYELLTFDTDFVLPFYGLDTAVLEAVIAMPSTSDVTPGNYYVIGVLDSGEKVTELEETNNVVVLPQVYVGPDHIDLVAVSASHALSETAAPGDSFDLTLTIQNASTLPVPEAAVATYVSADETLDEADRAVECTESLELNLEPSAEGTFTLGCAVPRARGTYYLLTELDPGDTLGDSDRTNNVAAAAGPITVDAPSPDLEVSEVSSDSYSVDWQGAVTLSATVTNSGDDPAPASTVGFYAGGELVCSASVEALEPDASAQISKECTLGASMVGTLALDAEVDANDAIYEASEANNTADGATDLSVAAPDINLVAAGVGIVAGGTSRAAGQTLDVYYEIENDGSQDAPSYRFIIYASGDTTITSDDSEFCILDPSGQAAGTTTDGASYACTVPTMPTGDYYIGMIVDTEDAVPETDEGDNVAVDSQNVFTMTE